MRHEGSVRKELLINGHATECTAAGKTPGLPSTLMLFNSHFRNLTKCHVRPVTYGCFGLSLFCKCSTCPPHKVLHKRRQRVSTSNVPGDWLFILEQI